MQSWEKIEVELLKVALVVEGAIEVIVLESVLTLEEYVDDTGDALEELSEVEIMMLAVGDITLVDVAE